LDSTDVAFSHSPVYDLVGAVRHHGKTACLFHFLSFSFFSLYCVFSATGHYTACCWNIVDGKWYSFNGRRVLAMRDSEVAGVVSSDAFVTV
jgi:hypothetical protein